MSTFRPSDRLAALPPYLFAEIDRRKEALRARDKEIIDLGVGDPDLPTPAPIIEALAEAARLPEHHRYATNAGRIELRQAIAAYYQRRFGVALDPETEVVVLLGTKEGIGHLPLAVVNPGEAVLIPDPGYPVYLSGTLFAGAMPRSMPLVAERGYQPDVGALEEVGLETVSLAYLNYPNNPTGALADPEVYARLVEIARRHRLLLASDAAYLEITADPTASHSILAVPGAREVAIEFGSFSKTFSMTGWRLGWAAGNASALRALVDLKSNLDSGCFEGVQMAGVRALELQETLLPELLATYDARRTLVVERLRAMGIEVFEPRGAFYVWARVPGEMRSVEFATKLLRATGVVVTPGVGFGRQGEGYFRIALCCDLERLRRAMTLLEGAGLWATSVS
ncbi:MAG: aminotransferase class I/II-fold pyridoxal phosphate-dependent enzyme [Candidatus Eiseniibacteriota bacterium]|jgi:LL-diaminopimelate aminotransferase